MELSAEKLATICEKHDLGSPPVIRLPSSGVINGIYRIGDELLLRVPKNVEDGIRGTLTESVAVPVVRSAGIRTPNLIVFDDDRDIVPIPFTVYEYVESIDLTKTDAEPVQLAEVWRELGRELARIHEQVNDCPDPLGRLDEPGRGETRHILTNPGLLKQSDFRWLYRTLERLAPAVDAAGEHRRFLLNDVQRNNILIRARSPNPVGSPRTFGGRWTRTPSHATCGTAGVARVESRRTLDTMVSELERTNY